MSHVYESTPDARQADTAVQTSRFRPRYRQLSPEEVQLHDTIKAKAQELETLFEKVADGRYKSLAMTDLEKSVMWIIKQLTA